MKGKTTYYMIEGSFKHFEFRYIKAEEAEEAARIESICFPPEEACPLHIIKERIALAGDCFLLAVDKKENKIAGFVNGICSNKCSLEDEMFTNTSLHDPEGSNIMICGVDVLPEYRGQGLAREMVCEFLRRQQSMGRKQAILTCIPSKIKMYEKFGFCDRGESDSTWGGEKWHEMNCILDL